ncbi:helix-turn-helix domain-containing protein [Eggerthella sp. YY7918]|uniref:helix-turn-helix domain-containing protein n=1 Tax=Eggerthella sp. (strain YY7918) TaxID=502558 RepID=UPI0005A0774A|nr:helix-turn-helix transcriptional regulator [Eggerthella sp. YY7918]
MTAKTRTELGRRIRVARIKRKLSQEQLALMIGVGRSYLAKIETGKRNPTIDFLEKVAIGLDVTLEELFKEL